MRPILATALACFAVLAGTASPAAAAQMAGVQAHLLWDGVDTQEVDRQLDEAKAAGARVVRVDFGWATLEERGKGVYSNYYLQRADRLVQEARNRGLKILFTFANSPCWASSAPEEVKQGCEGAWWSRGVQRYAPANPQDYADALAFVVGRYGSAVAAWEVWNEPNHSGYFKAVEPASAYAGLLRAAYPAAKAAHPSATVLGGALSGGDAEFTAELYRHGIRGSFDAFAIHPYSDDRSPLDPGSDLWIEDSFIRGVPAVWRVMLDNDDAKPIWLTEMGWSTCSIRGERQAWRNCVDEETQADYLLDAYREMRNWRYVRAGIWFNIKDLSATPGDKEDNFGLTRNDGSHKLAFSAMRRASRELAGPRLPRLRLKRPRLETPRTVRMSASCSGPASCQGRVELRAGGSGRVLASRRVTLRAGRARSLTLRTRGRSKLGERRLFVRVASRASRPQARVRVAVRR